MKVLEISPDCQLQVPQRPHPALIGGGEVVVEDHLLLHRAVLQPLLPADKLTVELVVGDDDDGRDPLHLGGQEAQPPGDERDAGQWQQGLGDSSQSPPSLTGRPLQVSGQPGAVTRGQDHHLELAWSTLIGRAPTLLRSHWSRASLVMLAPAVLCHKEPALRIQSPLLGALLLTGSLWHMRDGTSITLGQ